MNLAAIWDLPVVFVCENNLYSEMTPIQFSLKNKDLIDRAEGVRIPGIIVDGNDVEAVFNVTTEAVERARRGEGPTFIEAKTYRLNGHMYGDSETYRSKEEVAAWWEKEPIKRLGAKLVASGEASADELEAINHEVLQEIARAAEFARQSPEPGFEEIFTDVI